MRALIIDDEQHCIEALQSLIQKYCPEIEVVGTCKDGLCGLTGIENTEPDLVFLDIAMPKMNGFEMLSRLDDISFEIIFTTAYDNYAIKAFKVSAIDYLLKPVDRKELVKAIRLVKEKLYLKSRANIASRNKEQLNILLDNISSRNDAFPNIAIPTLEGLEIIKVDDILYVTGEGNYSQIHFRNKPPMLISKTIKYIEDRIEGHHFMRIHNSNLVNLKEISKYIKGAGGQVIMSDDKLLNVSRSRKDDLLKLLRAIN